MAGIDNRRRAVVKASAVGSLVGLAGCTSILGSSNNTQNEVTYLTDRTESRDAIEQIIAGFEESSDYSVDLQIVPEGNSQTEQLQKMIATGNHPDVIWKTSTDGYRWYNQGKLEPVNEAISEGNLPDPVSIDGNSYVAPGIINPLTFWYRSDIYEEKPQNWEEWLAATERVSSETEMHGMIMPAGKSTLATSLYVQYLWNNGVDIYSGPSDDIRVTIDEGNNRDRAIETFEWIEQIAENGPNTSGWGWGETEGAFVQGQAAAIPYIAGYMIDIFASDRPDLADSVEPALHPQAADDSKSQYFSYMEGHMVWKEGNQTEGAKEFVKYFHSSEDFIKFHLSSPLAYIPPTKKLIDSEAYRNNEFIKKSPEFVSLLKDNLDNFTTYLATGDDGAPNLLATKEYSQQFFGQAADQMLTGGLSPSETVDWVAEKIRGIE